MNNGCLDYLPVDDIYMTLVWGYGEKPAINICLEFWHEKKSLAPWNNALGRLNVFLHLRVCMCLGACAWVSGDNSQQSLLFCHWVPPVLELGICLAALRKILNIWLRSYSLECLLLFDFALVHCFSRTLSILLSFSYLSA